MKEKTCCFFGHRTINETEELKSKLKEIIENAGGKVSGSVSKKTDYLINNDIASNSSKNKTAKELGVSIITEEQFLKEILKEGE